MTDGLTIAVPKGALYADAAARLRAAGIDVPDDAGRRLTVTTSDGSTLLFLRPTDVPAYVEKYQSLIDSYGWTPGSFAADYPHLIRVSATRARIW